MIELYLATAAGGWAVDGVVQGWRAHASAVDALAAWAQEIARARGSRWRRARVDLWLSGGLARPFVCGPLGGLAGWREAEAAAAGIAPDATGLAGPCAVALEDWPGDATLATAIGQPLADAIATHGGRRGSIAWRSVRPRWAAALDDALRERPRLRLRLFAFVEDDALTMVGGPSSEAAAVPFDHAATRAPAPDAADLEALWQRTLLGRDLSPQDASIMRLDTAASSSGPTPGNWPRANLVGGRDVA
ncbi:MAG: hypothetical protein ACTHL8_12230 [Burkholderiaceae bacterium]